MGSLTIDVMISTSQLVLEYQNNVKLFNIIKFYWPNV